MESLATQNRSLFTKLKQWFYTNVLKLNDNTRVYGKRSAARKTYALMLKAEKAATNKTSGEGVAYSAKKSLDNLPSRANNKGDFINQFYNALTRPEWKIFYDRITDVGGLNSSIGDVFYTQINDKFIVAERQYTKTKDAHDFVIKDVYSSEVEESYLWDEILESIGGKAYDSRTIQTEFARFAQRYGESGLLRRYDSTSGSYAELYAEQRGYS